MGHIIVKTEEEITLMRKSCELLARTFGAIKPYVKAGISTLELDKIAEDFILSNNAVPAFKGYAPGNHKPFPGTLCTSLNSAVVHGIPSSDTVLKDGDIISIDCGLRLNGYFADSAYTFSIGEAHPKDLLLLKVTKESLYLAINNAIVGKRVGDIAYAVQSHVEKNGFSVVRELVGHGIGKQLHEEPEVPNYGRRGNGPILVERMVLAIEPMINAGRAAVTIGSDGWTVLTRDGSTSAHFEHTVVVRKNKAEILTNFELLEN